MIKDVIVNLERNKSRDIVLDYAITVARTFDAHLTGIVVEQAIVPIFSMPEGIPAAVIEDILAENRKTARSAIGRLVGPEDRRHTAVLERPGFGLLARARPIHPGSAGDRFQWRSRAAVATAG